MPIILAILVYSFSAGAADSMFPPGSQCVGYKVKKHFLSVFGSTVVAKNCEISGQLLPVVGGGYQIEVSIPIAGFNSGKREDDEKIAELLKAGEYPDILFRSIEMSEADWREFLKGGSKDLAGEITMQGKTFKVRAPLTLNKVEGGLEIVGGTTVSLKQFELDAVREVSGFLSESDSELEFQYRLQSVKFLGADRILNIDDAKKTGLDPVKTKTSWSEKTEKEEK